MRNKETSLQAQSPLADAQNSVDAAENAITQAQTHPSSRMIEQAENSLETADRAVAQVPGEQSQSDAHQQTVNQLQTAEDKLSSVQRKS